MFSNFLLLYSDEEDYPDSPESNETVLAQPYRTFSPVRDAATNTGVFMGRRLPANMGTIAESPIQESYRANLMSQNRFGDVPFENTVQNVQNQIIQENMQQHQALLRQNLMQTRSGNPLYQQNLYRSDNPNLASTSYPYHSIRTQNQLQGAINSQAMPQEPRKSSFRQNLATNFKQSLVSIIFFLLFIYLLQKQLLKFNQ